ncbi:GNAT family N-acetyltransferase [Halobacillus litoralis]|uniref:GNAT family N-acetyltransferase n=1 Tax=Halobacillus litoralis TaxID=45668 RepID=UPI001CD6B3CE|nr:GNAT family protein [Halobacillus litoralis]MCA0970220.1 GNAT family N-acetyltransferase [Halobacillus litoralis]
MVKGKHIHMRPLQREDAEPLLQFQASNREFFETYSMDRVENYYSVEYQRSLIEKQQAARKKDEEYAYGIFLNGENRLIGTINLFHVMRGPLQSAFIGYFLDRRENGRGYTTEAVGLLETFAFEKLGLHRIEAGVMPHNQGSIRVLEKSGFQREGLARKNVRINGKWEDHVVLAALNPADE